MIMSANENYTLYSGGLKGAESYFGEAAEKWGVKEVNFCYSGQKTNRQKNLVVITSYSIHYTKLYDITFRQ